MSLKHFPCRECGANVEFKPSVAALVCPYCSTENRIPQSDEEVEELDFEQALSRDQSKQTEEQLAIDCGPCGASFTLAPNITSDRCPFCDAPVVAQAKSRKLLKPKAVLPFAVEQKRAAEAYKKWLSGRWFAPNDLVKRARRGSIDGMYIPFWTYDCQTQSFYKGQHGTYYWVEERYSTTENGKRVTKTRRVRKTRWRSAKGVVWVHFDDLLVLASRSLPESLTQGLEPWDLSALVPYDDAYLSGFRSECYQLGLAQGFDRAKQLMESPIRREIKQDIGGDTQRISSVRSRYDQITFKHVLLPVWISAYRYKGKPYRVLVNARTAEVQGERPWSAIKIALFALAVLGIIYFIVQFSDR